ncbi:hypothetical protein F9U43_02035 [Pectobacterium versatile]|nr:tail fiber protein [Pectobacterium versatile]MBQ4761508.1 hypothetical protein [Pectobacterium versatile]MCH5083502.1 tail fiber protein [Pectobacterium versatile]
MRNGAHGLGSVARPRLNGSTGGAAGCGFFSYSAHQDDNPFAFTGSSGIHVQEAENYGWDLLGRDGGGVALKLRQINNNVPSEWVDVFHSGNLTPEVIGALSPSDIAGMPQLFPGAVAPTGWLKCNGQRFDTTQYSVLASRYPSGFLPDLRGEFVRGWDDGRGADAGRALLSAQNYAVEAHTHPAGTYNQGSGVPLYVSVGMATGGDIVLSKTRENENAGNETRPRNIAFNYIVRAA